MISWRRIRTGFGGTRATGRTRRHRGRIRWPAGRWPWSCRTVPVADLACGPSGSALLAARGGRRVTAVDVSEVALDLLARAARQDGVADLITLVHADLAGWRPEPGRYALVLCTGFWDRAVFGPVTRGSRERRGARLAGVHGAGPGAQAVVAAGMVPGAGRARVAAAAGLHRHGAAGRDRTAGRDGMRGARTGGACWRGVGNGRTGAGVPAGPAAPLSTIVLGGRWRRRRPARSAPGGRPAAAGRPAVASSRSSSTSVRARCSGQRWWQARADTARPPVTLNSIQRAVRKCSSSLTSPGAIRPPTAIRTRLVARRGPGQRRAER